MATPASHHHVEIRIRELKQLFNSMDPAPFLEKDLDSDAEQFIVESAEEFPLGEPIELVVHLASAGEEKDPHHLVLTAVHHYFQGRSEHARLAFRRLMRQGQWSLVIGVVFLAVCFSGAELLDKLQPSNRWLQLLREGMIIAGWVAMWRPMQIYLYDWWPLRRNLKLMRKLSRMPVKVVLPKTSTTSATPGGATAPKDPPQIPKDK